MTERCCLPSHQIANDESYSAKSCTFKATMASLAVFTITVVALAIILALANTAPEAFATIGGNPLLGTVSGLAGVSLLLAILGGVLLKCRSHHPKVLEETDSDSTDYSSATSATDSESEEDIPVSSPATPKKNEEKKSREDQRKSSEKQKAPNPSPTTTTKVEAAEQLQVHEEPTPAPESPIEKQEALNPSPTTITKVEAAEQLHVLEESTPAPESPREEQKAPNPSPTTTTKVEAAEQLQVHEESTPAPESLREEQEAPNPSPTTTTQVEDAPPLRTTTPQADDLLHTSSKAQDTPVPAQGPETFLTEEGRRDIAYYSKILNRNEVFLYNYETDNGTIFTLLVRGQDDQVHPTHYFDEKERMQALEKLTGTYLVCSSFETDENVETYLLDQIHGTYLLEEIEEAEYIINGKIEEKPVFALTYFADGEFITLCDADKKTLEDKLPALGLHIDIRQEQFNTNPEYSQEVGQHLALLSMHQGSRPEDVQSQVLTNEYMVVHQSNKDGLNWTPYKNFCAVVTCDAKNRTRIRYFKTTTITTISSKTYTYYETRHSAELAFAKRVADAVFEKMGVRKPVAIVHAKSERALVVDTLKNTSVYAPVDSLSLESYTTVEDWQKLDGWTKAEENFLSATIKRFPSQNVVRHFPHDRAYVFRPKPSTYLFFKTKEALDEAVRQDAIQAYPVFLKKILVEEGSYWYDTVTTIAPQETLHVVYRQEKGQIVPHVFSEQGLCDQFLADKGPNRRLELEGKGPFSPEIENYFVHFFKTKIKKSDPALIPVSFSPFKNGSSHQQTVWFVNASPRACFKDRDSAEAHWMSLPLSKSEKKELNEKAKKDFKGITIDGTSPNCRTMTYRGVKIFALCLENAKFKFFKTEEQINDYLVKAAIKKVEKDYLLTKVLVKDKNCWWETLSIPRIKAPDLIINCVFYKDGEEIKREDLPSHEACLAFIKEKGWRDLKTEWQESDEYPEDLTAPFSTMAYTSEFWHRVNNGLFNKEFYRLQPKKIEKFNAFKAVHFIRIRHEDGHLETRCFKNKGAADRYATDHLQGYANSSLRRERQLAFAKRVLGEVKSEEPLVFKHLDTDSQKVFVVRPPKVEAEYLTIEEAEKVEGKDALTAWEKLKWKKEELALMAERTKPIYQKLLPNPAINQAGLGSDQYSVVHYKHEGFYCLFYYESGKPEVLQRKYCKTEDQIQKVKSRFVPASHQEYQESFLPY